MKMTTKYPDGRVEEFEGTAEEFVKVMEPRPLPLLKDVISVPTPFFEGPWTLTDTSSATITFTDDDINVSGSTITLTCPEPANS